MAKRATAKAVPTFASERAEREYWETHDAGGVVDWASARRVVFPNLKASTETISLRLPTALLADLKVLANKRDVPFVKWLQNLGVQQDQQVEMPEIDDLNEDDEALLAEVEAEFAQLDIESIGDEDLFEEEERGRAVGLGVMERADRSRKSIAPLGRWDIDEIKRRYARYCSDPSPRTAR